MYENELSGSARSWNELSFEQKYQSSVGGHPADRAVATLRPLSRRLRVSDLCLVSVSMAIGLLLSSRESAWQIDPTLAIYGTPVVISLIWVTLLSLRGSYDPRIVGLGTEELRRVLSATVWSFALVAGVSFLVRADVSRSYAFVSLPVGLILIVASRFAWRSWLYRQRAHGVLMERTLVIGAGPAARELSKKLSEESYIGFCVVGEIDLPDVNTEPLEDWLQRLDQTLESSGATTVAIDPGDSDPHHAVRELAWHIEGRGFDLLISPGLIDLAGPRLSVRPASGLPLLHLDEVSLTRQQRFSKRLFDVVGSILLLLALSPLMALCAVVVKISSPGPIIYKQNRIGRWGRSFDMYKFRTMKADADGLKQLLREQHDLDEPMFKVKNDPRITKYGALLRRWSLDELPQLWNSLGGSMSLVGPRPHPVDDVSRYGMEAFRRLALKPGLTGLWQVEGRSELSWSQALQLDLYYVERWSLFGDALLLVRTFRAVIQGRGAQ